MGYEKRGGNLYYYKKKRVNGRVVSQYIGGGELARFTYELDQADRELESMEQAERQAARAESILLDDQVNNTLEMMKTHVEQALMEAGYHKVKGEWRKKRKPRR